MSTDLESSQLQSLRRRSPVSTRPSKLETFINQRPPPAVDRFSVPAAAYVDLTPTQRAARVGWQLGVAAVDLTFGTHWAIAQRLKSSSKLRSLRQDNRLVTQLLATDPLLTQASAVAQRRVHKNAHTVLALNRHGHAAAQVRKYCYGDSVVAGGLPFGAGLTIGPQIGGGFSAALTAASVPLLWIGAPILAAAALGVAAHEAVRYRRAVRLEAHVERLGSMPVMGNEGAVQSLLSARLRSKRIHAATKSVSLIGCAVSAPLLVVGIIPGVAVVTPAAAMLTWAWSYHHNHLRYRPSLSVEDRIMLGGKHDIINRVHLAHQTRSTLKSIKEQKRLLYPRGAQGILGLRETAKSLAWIRRWWRGVPRTYPTPRETVFTFLRALSHHEVDFVRYQETLQRHDLAKLYRSGLSADDTNRRQAELARQGRALATWLSGRIAESRLLNRPNVALDAGQVVLHFVAFLQRYRLLDHFVRQAILRHGAIKLRFVAQGVIIQDQRNFHFELAHVSRLMAAHQAASSPSSQRLVDEMCQLAEAYVLNQEKKRLAFFERELLDILAYRLSGHTQPDFPRA